MGKINKYKMVAALVRSFFSAFTAGIIDCHVKDSDDKLRPIVVKKAMLSHYEAVGHVFNDTMFYPLAYINYTFEEIEHNLRHIDIQSTTMIDLVKMACRTDGIYNAMVAEYKRNFTSLLGGRVPDTAEHLRSYTHGNDSETVDSDTAIALCVRTVMLAYARGIRRAGTGKVSLHQATLYRLLLESMTVLLNDRQPSLNGVNDDTALSSLFIRICQNEHNFNVMTREMDRTYTELVKNEGIISQDDNAN